jgi:hypothetical protein
VRAYLDHETASMGRATETISGGAVRPGGARIPHTVDLALDALDRSGVRWALLREAELAMPDGDVSILCDRADLGGLEAALRPLGFGRLHRYGRGPHRFFVAYDVADERWIRLDVVTELAFGRYQELRLDAATGCLERRHRVGRLAVLAEDDAFWTLLLHSMLDPGTSSPARRRVLRELAAAASTEGGLGLALEGALAEHGQATVLLELTQAGDWTALERLGPKVRATWIRRGSTRVRARAALNAALRRVGRLPPLCRGGLVFRAGGPDAELAAAVVGRWCLSRRLLRVGASRTDAVTSLLAARWHAAFGRLVVLDVRRSASFPRFLERLSRVRELASVVDDSSSRPVSEAVARIWGLYVGRTHV